MKNKIWFDLDNLPHVPLFKPIFAELENFGINHIITARDFNNTIEQLNYWNIKHQAIGIHAGKNKFKKIMNLFYRASQLNKYVKGKDIDLAISHGSRTQLIVAKKLNIPSILMLDYEYTESMIFNHLATNLLMPNYIPEERLKQAGFNIKKIIRYNGFKEQLYLNDFKPDTNFRKNHDIPEEKILIIVRPPNMVGNYHDNRSEKLLIDGLEYFLSNEDVLCLVMSRTKEDKNLINSKFKNNRNLRFLESPVDGLQLLWAADIAISGGGTMNREGALLGTKTYSIFTGRRPYLDEYLANKGRLVFINRSDDFLSIKIKKYLKKESTILKNEMLVSNIVDLISNYKGKQ